MAKRGEHNIIQNYNSVLYCEQYGEPDITIMMKIARLRWGGHMIRMTGTCQEEL